MAPWLKPAVRTRMCWKTQLSFNLSNTDEIAKVSDRP